MRLPAPLRTLARARSLSAGVVATLAIGIATLTTTYAVVDATIVRQPPFADAARLAILYTVRNPPGEPSYRERWSYPRAQLLARLVGSFEGMASYSSATLTIASDEDAESVKGEVVTPRYFAVLRVGAALGRTLVDADNDASAPNALVVLGHDLWMRRYAGDSSIIGRAVRVNGMALTVVGVLPAGFRGLTGVAQLWFPASLAPRLTYGDYLVTDQSFITVVGRLRQGTSLDAARSELAAIAPAIDKVLPAEDPVPGERVSATAVALNEARIDPRSRASLLVLLAAVGVLHLLACANVISLLLGRALSRRRENAVRVALGSGARRLFAHNVAEGLALALAGGTAGLVLAWQASAFVAVPLDAWSARNFYGSVGRFDDPAFSARVAVFGVLLTLVTALLVSVPPATSAVGVNVSVALKEGARGSGAGSRFARPVSVRGVVVALEAALAVLLVVSAGLLIDSFQRMRRTQIGVEARHVLTFQVQPSEVRVPPSAAPAFISRLLGAISRVPGVEAATVDGGAPLSGTARSVLYIMGRPIVPPKDAPPVLRHYVAPDHFRTLGIPLRRGRMFTASDVAGQPRVAIISEAAARRFWPNEDPIGQRVWFGGGSSFDRPDSSAEIVGIVGDVMYEPLDRRPNRASFYTPYAQFTYAWRFVFVRTTGDPLSVVPAIRRAVHDVAPDVPLLDVQTLTARIEGTWSRHRFDALLFGAFGAAALLLAASGIFAVVAYSVEQRTREIGIRAALGAGAGSIIALVLREGMAWPGLGLLAGMVASLAATRLLGASLYEVRPTDPGVLVVTVSLLVLAAVAACLLPAQRATRVDPMVALRSE